MTKLKIDIDQVCMALEDHGSTNWYIDRTNGDVIPIFEDFADEPECSYERIEEDPDRYIEISPLDSRQGFALMEEFTLRLDQGEARRSLERALRLPKPFRCFKDTTEDFGDIRTAWFDFHNRRLRELAHKFLREEKIDYVEAMPGENV